jgi:aromatic-L-amino-acid decarboxylase
VNRAGFDRRLIVYASEEAHSSVEKGVRIAGYGSENLRLIPTDEAFAMRPDKLGEAVLADLDRGLTPACVIATAGTTSSSALDPIAAVGEICRRHGLWLHVDAAYGGSAALLPEKRGILDGVELADSFVFNPHKWMLTNFDCSVYFVKDESALVRTFEIDPEYLKTAEDTRVRNLRDWGIPLGRRFRALKLWFVLRAYGAEGIRRMLREHLRLAGLFRSWVDEDPRFERMAPVPLGLICFRIHAGLEPEALDELNRKFLERLNAGGKLMLTHTTLRGRFALRMSIGSWTTRERHVREAWDLMKSTAAGLLEG